MRARRLGIGLSAIAALCLNVTPGNAAQVGSGQFQMQANGIDVCLLGTFDDVSRDVFGTPIDLADAGNVFCPSTWSATISSARAPRSRMVAC